jgi:transposase
MPRRHRCDGSLKQPQETPPYSPDLNPIELAFSKLKTLLRKYAERTRQSLWDRIGNLVEEFTPTQCRNYFKHCGYSEN